MIAYKTGIDTEEKLLVIVSYTYVQTHFVLSDFHTVGETKSIFTWENFGKKKHWTL